MQACLSIGVNVYVDIWHAIVQNDSNVLRSDDDDDDIDDEYQSE